MTRIILPLALAATVFALGNALANHAWLTAAPLAVLVCVGLAMIAPGSSEHSSPPDASGDALATGGEG